LVAYNGQGFVQWPIRDS